MRFLSVQLSAISAKSLILLCLAMLVSACAGGNAVEEQATTIHLPDDTIVESVHGIKTAQPAEIVEKPVSSDAKSPSWESRLPAFRLTDLSIENVDFILGQESLRRDELAGHIRRYDGVNCQLYLVVFDGKIDHIEARDPVSGQLQNAEECGRGLARVAANQAPASF